MTYLKRFLLILGVIISNICAGQFSIVVADPPSGGECIGKLVVNSEESMIGFTYLWNTGATDYSINNLCGGIYYVTITSTNGCETVLKKVLTGTSDCPELDNKNFDALIKPSCPTKANGEIAILESGPYSYSWDSQATTSTIGSLLPGDYCVTISIIGESKCNVTRCFVVPESNNCRQETSPIIKEDPVLIINEVSNGASTGKEFVELVVVKKNNDCSPVDLRGYILDDNNGDFSVDLQSTASGITPGHFRFSNSMVWQSVPVGSIILIYNGDDKNSSIQLADDPTDANNDNVYVLPSSSDLILGNSKNPSFNNNSYNQEEPEVASWLMLSMYDKGDAVQVRTPEGKFMHGISFGSSLRINGGPDSLHLSTLSGKGKGYAFQSGDINNATNYLTYQVDENRETPGFPNNESNGSFIQNMCEKKAVNPEKILRSPLKDVSVFPNPFNDQIRVVTTSEEAVKVIFILKDIVGRDAQEWAVDFDEGENEIILSIRSKKIPAGLYTLMGTTQKSGVIFSTKVVRL